VSSPTPAASTSLRSPCIGQSSYGWASQSREGCPAEAARGTSQTGAPRRRTESSHLAFDGNCRNCVAWVAGHSSARESDRAEHLHGRTTVERTPKRFVYVLRSASDPRRHYVGLSADVRKRLTSHNAGQSPHTSKHRPWTLLISLEFRDEPSAVRFEKYLKSGAGRAFAKRHFG